MHGCKTGIILSPEGLPTVQTNIRSRKCRRETIWIPSKLTKAATKHPFGSISHWRWSSQSNFMHQRRTATTSSIVRTSSKSPSTDHEPHITYLCSHRRMYIHTWNARTGNKKVTTDISWTKEYRMGNLRQMEKSPNGRERSSHLYYESFSWLQSRATFFWMLQSLG